jgi:hypothetical protein
MVVVPVMPPTSCTTTAIATVVVHINEIKIAYHPTTDYLRGCVSVIEPNADMFWGDRHIIPQLQACTAKICTIMTPICHTEGKQKVDRWSTVAKA